MARLPPQPCDPGTDAPSPSIPESEAPPEAFISSGALASVEGQFIGDDPLAIHLTAEHEDHVAEHVIAVSLLKLAQHPFAAGLDEYAGQGDHGYFAAGTEVLICGSGDASQLHVRGGFVKDHVRRLFEIHALESRRPDRWRRWCHGYDQGLVAASWTVDRPDGAGDPAVASYLRLPPAPARPTGVRRGRRSLRPC